MHNRSRVEALSISSDPARIREARRWVAGIAEDAGLDDGESRAMALAVSEACSNIHRHAYGGRSDGRIDLRLEIGDKDVRLSVQDYGPPFEPVGWIPPNLDRPAEGGYGIYLMRTLMDLVEYQSSSAGTRLVLVKKRGSAPS